jgi:hypothetical protein
MVTLLKVAGLILGVALVGGCAVALSSDAPQVEPESQSGSLEAEAPVESTLQASSPSLDSPVPGEVETATFALG